MAGAGVRAKILGLDTVATEAKEVFTEMGAEDEKVIVLVLKCSLTGSSTCPEEPRNRLATCLTKSKGGEPIFPGRSESLAGVKVRRSLPEAPVVGGGG